MTASTEEQAQYLATQLNQRPEMDYNTFVTGILGTHWDPKVHSNVLTYVHINRINPKLDNSVRDKFQDFFRRFYRMEGVLPKMAIISNTLDVLDMQPMPTEPESPADYAFMEVIMARISGKKINLIGLRNYNIIYFKKSKIIS